MDNTARISFSAVSHIGTACTVNENRIYANGKFMFDCEADYAQISLESRGDQFLFALSDGMDAGVTNKGGISAVEDIKKFHQKVKTSTKDIQIKLDEMLQCIDQTNNLLYSVSLGENTDKGRKPAFAGLIIDNGSIAAINLGSSRIYKFDGNNLKLMVNDYKRAERLLKLGIITDQQAEMLSLRYKSTGDDSNVAIRKSEVFSLREGHVYLLCSNGLTDAVNEEIIFDILASNSETDAAANLLVKEALKNEGEDNITAVVIRVDEAAGNAAEKSESGVLVNHSPRRINKPTRIVKRRKLDVTKLISSIILIIIIVAVFFVGFMVWLNLRSPQLKDTSASDSSRTTTVDTSGAGTVTGNTSDQGIADEDADPNTISADTTTVKNTDVPAVPDNAGNPDTTPSIKYTVKRGDSLYAISKRFYGTPKKYMLIIEANGIKDPDKIIEGQVLKIPAVK